ncbi:unnamed protein product [Darwinula stevensoni]|uniref:Ral GTPase-activating protein subunit alpha/beta N-terminal domain-containing protein n=1 Tax=Darwinula stevensoni TaxID=69355 RepID=A0A7R8ZX39_9CRUS|nr:unnamed protein product [Darwinula stevensoni]CAG0878641.1 unnamed protein product [Darwinula stevensoni]
MYSEWTSLTESIQCPGAPSRSVLRQYPMGVGREVSVITVKHLTQNLGLTATPASPSFLLEERDVDWSMEVICHGLTLPLSDHDTLRDCVNVYCEWLSALCSLPKVSVPRPVLEDPNLYCRKMIKHLYNLFVPRHGDPPDITHKQAVLCHRVLRTLQTVAQTSANMTYETWETLLLFLLSINDTLLSPPTIKDDIGDQLCERVLSVLFEIWLLACHKCYPTPPLWKTFQEVCRRWRHRPALVDQWNRANFALAARVLKFMYGPAYADLKLPEEDANLVPANMENSTLAQTWYRMLRIMGDPVELAKAAVISDTHPFIEWSGTQESVVEPCQHPCLGVLPQAFLKAMRGISGLVDAFLGFPMELDSLISPRHGLSLPPPPPTQHSETPPPPRERRGSTGAKGNSPNLRVTVISGGISPHPYPSGKSSMVAGRPRCNSILHLFGSWLFEAALLGVSLPPTPTTRDRVQRHDSVTRRPSAVLADRRMTETQDLPEDVKLEKFELGRAEALGALCRIFCSKKTGEDILPVYLARFYIAIQQGLRVSGGPASPEAIASILLNSEDFFRLDLDGVQILLPDVVNAIEAVLAVEKEPMFKSGAPVSALRSASINILLSILSVPMHLGNLNIRELLPSVSGSLISVRAPTFLHLKPRLINTLTTALQYETDPNNTEMLLGGLMTCVQEAAAYETLPRNRDISGFDIHVSSIHSDPPSIHSSEMGSLKEEDLESPHGSMSLDLASIDTASTLFVKATYLVCHRLITAWKGDLNVSLAALELLCGLARLHFPEQDLLECKRAVRWLCDYIVYQCSRPPPAHSRDLHSSIVAAYRCLSLWLLHYPTLLHDRDSLNIVLEVVELGISGSKSRTKLSGPVVMKQDKDLKPVSMRVRDAAEAVLSLVFNQVGYFPSPCGSESLSSLLDEESLVKQGNVYADGDGPVDHSEAVQFFRYFVLDNSIILALLEEPLGNDQDPHPTVTMLLRGPFGRLAWTMQLRPLPRHKSGLKTHVFNPGRPLPISDLGVHFDYKPKYFPESADRIPLCKADKAIPSLDSLIASDPKLQQSHAKLEKILASQMAMEKQLDEKSQSVQREYPNPETECRAPSVVQEFQTARLFLSHFNLLSLESLKVKICSAGHNMSIRQRKNTGYWNKMQWPVPPLCALNSKESSFVTDLEQLDCMGDRTFDTIHVFYVRSGQKSIKDILTNVNSFTNQLLHASDTVHFMSPSNVPVEIVPQESNRTVGRDFLEFLYSLGSPVNVHTHAGWTGHINTAWRVREKLGDFSGSEEKKTHGGMLYNGEDQVLYWADAVSEIACVIPSRKPKLPHVPHQASAEISQVLKQGSSTERSRAQSLDTDSQSSGFSETETQGSNRKGAKLRTEALITTKVLVAWIENFQDVYTLPIGDMVSMCSTGLEPLGFFQSPQMWEKLTTVICIHPLQTGLYRVHLQGNIGKSLVTPLVDGMVVSRCALGALVRQTALNIGHRRWLEADNCYQPHVRRRLKIQEMVQKYCLKMDTPEFLSHLFCSTP